MRLPCYSLHRIHPQHRQSTQAQKPRFESKRPMPRFSTRREQQESNRVMRSSFLKARVLRFNGTMASRLYFGIRSSKEQMLQNPGLLTAYYRKDIIVGPVKELVKGIGYASLATAGILIVVYSLERYDKLSSNKGRRLTFPFSWQSMHTRHSTRR